MIIIFSDLHGTQKKIDELFNSLKELKHKKNEIILFHVQDLDKEKKLNFKNQFYNFIDLETNEEVKINPYLYKNEYENLQTKFNNLFNPFSQHLKTFAKHVQNICKTFPKYLQMIC